GETGRYLVMYLIRGNTTHNNRAVFKGRVTVNTAPIEGSYGTDYVRNNGNDEFYVRGYAILDITSGDDIAIEWTRDSGSGSPAGTLTAGISELMIVRLPDTSSTTYSHYSDSSDTASYGSSSWASLSWNTTEEETDTSVIEKQAGNTSIRLKKVAKYLVIYSVPFTLSSSSRTQRISQATLAGTALEQSHSYTYLRDSNNEFGAPSAMFIVNNTSANQDLSIQVQLGNADTASSVARTTNESGLFVMELPSTTETVLTYDGTGGQNVAGGGSNVTINYARTESQRDSASFTLPSITEVEVEKDADYLFMANIKITRSGTSSKRLTRGARWELNGVDLTRGRHGTYLRGNQSTTDTYDGAFNPSMVIGLSANDRVEMEIFDAGDDGNSPNDTTVASEVAVNALNIGTLFPAPSGSLTIDIVDGAGSSVTSPGVAMNSAGFNFACHTSTGTFGTSSEKIRVDNGTQTATWTASVAASAATDVWDSAGTDYDFNDPTSSGCGDGADADGLAGQMSVDPSGGTITPEGGCTSTGVSLGSSSAFSEDSVDSITIVSAGGTADTGCYWDITGVGISQTIPAEQPAASDYNLDLVLSIVAS
ncbi:MAG: hypothetical protein R3B38_03035, partial [Patescibacteria group bacterium]